jgi:hypothetical protein
MAIPAAAEPGPLVTLVRCLTVAKVDSMGFVRAQVDPVLGRVVGEGQQFFHVVGDLGGGLGPLGAVQLVEGDAGVVLVLGVPNLGQGLLRPRVCGLRQTPRARLRFCGTNLGPGSGAIVPIHAALWRTSYVFFEHSTA